jgi:hypothetical protein
MSPSDMDQTFLSVSHPSPNSASTRARTSAGSRSTSSHPANPQNGTAPVSIDARVRSGRVAAKTMDATAVTQTEDDVRSEADGVRDRLDLGGSIIQHANFRHGIRQPEPRPCRTRGQNVLSCSKKALNLGTAQDARRG